MAHYEGGPHERGIPVADVVRYTPGKRVALGKSPLTGPGIKMCDTDGERSGFIINDTVKVGTGPTEPGFAIGMIKPETGGFAVRALAGGAVTAGHKLFVKMSTTDEVIPLLGSGTVNLPKFADEDDAEVGYWIVAEAVWDSSSTGEDLADSNGDFFPSLLVRMLPESQQYQVGTESVVQNFPVHIELADVAASGDIFTFTPGFVGTIKADEFSVTDPATTAAKSVTFSLKINGVAVTGGEVVVTSALATPAGANIPGSAVTATNAFDANDEVTVTAVVTAAFVEGAGDLNITLRQPTAEA